MHISGREVLIVNGAYRGYKAKLEDVDVDNYSVSVTIEQVIIIDIINVIFVDIGTFTW